jgi:hypothetical protein
MFAPKMETESHLGVRANVILLAMLQAFQVQRRVLDYHDLYWRLPNPRMRASVALGIGRAP